MLGPPAEVVVKTVLEGLSPGLRAAAGEPLAVWSAEGIVYAAADGAYAYRWRSARAPPAGDADLGAVTETPARPAETAECAVRAAMSQSRPTYPCLPIRGPITVDGSLEEWVEVPALTLETWRHARRPRAVQAEDGAAGWRDANDLSASIRAAYDAGGLCLAVEVADDAHEPAGPGAHLWRGDAVEVLLEVDAEARPAPSARALHLAVACRDGRTVVEVLRGGAGAAACQCAARRSEAGVTYEFVIPWEVLGRRGPRFAGVPTTAPGAERTRLGLGVLVTDDDGAGVKSALEFGGGISGGLIPSALGVLAMVPGR